MDVISSLIEDQLDIAVASAMTKMLDGEMSDKASMMYLTPSLDASGQLQLNVNDENGEVTSARFQGASLVIDPMALVSELEEDITANGGELEDVTVSDYRAAITRMRETCDALEAILDKVAE